ncbi:ABC transporter permease [Uliginosibacterium sp. sgz301328]|uniref:ABC transporter permease n=1 Tax=Uliginosibacterium sp. sgz301328 TaxID=3243764 RepID=UPI00359CFD99
MPSALAVAAAVVALLIAVPVLAVASSLFSGGTGEVWRHLLDTVLPRYLTNTLILCAVVGIGVAVIGVGTAWATTMLEFPGRRFFDWALILPLAVPAYIMAYVYTDFFQFVGPFQTWLRDTFGWTRADYWFPDVRTLGGACAMFIFVFYPYVYMLARTAFLERVGAMLDAGQSLGLSPWARFWRISLPLARPAIVAGLALVMMETLADYGTVQYFAVQTFTTGIYRAWFSLGDRVAAAQLATALLVVVALVLLLERASRGRARYAGGGKHRPVRRSQLGRIGGWSVTAACALPLFFGFILPAGLLLHMAITQGDAQFGERYFRLVRNSALLAGVTAAIAVLLALVLTYNARATRSRLAVFFNRVVGLGYAVPGAVIAVGVLIPVARLDNWLAATIQSLTGHNPGLLLTGGIFALVYAYLVRYLTVALQGVEGGLLKVTPNMDDAAQSLGSSRADVMRRVHWPLLRGSLLTTALLVFVDVMKELPATLVMRPFNFDTLATQANILASDQRLAEASTASLTIVAAGLLPVIVLSRRITASR